MDGGERLKVGEHAQELRGSRREEDREGVKLTTRRSSGEETGSGEAMLRDIEGGGFELGRHSGEEDRELRGAARSDDEGSRSGHKEGLR